ncbi:ATP-binding protein [Candidatus Lokiarchaeum ossiferum]|uniref:ATP-binding protein n=1 Tax=Candidatus Lokiarchaeum ossiferum TaxID=2951803 RepID=UPI00352E8F8B
MTDPSPEATQITNLQQELALYKSKYYTLLNNVRESVAIYKPIKDGSDFQIIDLNPSACQTEHVSFEDVKGGSLIETFPGVEQFGLLEILKNVWKSGNAQKFPLRMYQDERIQGWRDNFIFKMPGNEIVAVYEDKTAEKQLIQDLEITKALLNQTLQQSPDGLIIADANSKKILFINQIAVSLLGIESISVVNLNEIEGFWDVFDKNRNPVAVNEYPLIKAINGQFTKPETLLIKRTSDSKEFWCEAKGYPIFDEKGIIFAGCFLFSDITERIYFRQQVKMLAKFPEENPFPVMRISMDGKVLFHNKASSPLLKKWNFDGEFLNSEEVINPLDAMKMDSKIVQLDVDVKALTFSVIFIPIPDSNMINIYAYDISEIKMLSKFPEQNPNPVIRLDRNGFVKYHNKASLPLLQFWGFRNHNIYADEILHELTKVHNTSEIGKVETQIGEKFYSIFLKSIENTDLINLYALDITEKVKTMQNFIKSQERYYNLFYNMLDGYAYHAIILNENGSPIDYEFIDINPAFTEMTGITREMAIGKKVTQIVPNIKDDTVDWIGTYGKVALSGKSITFENFSQGLNKHFAVSSYCPERGYFVTVFRDITEQKRLSKEIENLNQDLEVRIQQRTLKLEAVNRELETFSYSVSHDLRAPLRGIDGFSQAILEDYNNVLDETGQDYLRRIRSGVQRMGDLINDMLQLSRLTRMELHKASVNLSSIAQDIIDDLFTADPERQIIIKIQKNLTHYCDFQLIRSVLQNLLENAWKFTRNTLDPQIEFGKMLLDEQITFFVRDNGAGFDMSYYNKLFGTFQRLHSAHEFEGTGIGLATVQRIIHKHGGTIRAEGKVNEGATFYFTLN